MYFEKIRTMMVFVVPLGEVLREENSRKCYPQRVVLRMIVQTSEMTKTKQCFKRAPIILLARLDTVFSSERCECCGLYVRCVCWG